MDQMIKEKSAEVKEEMTELSRNMDHVHRYSRRKSYEIGASLLHRSQEDCLRVLQSVGKFRMFPGLAMTNIYEAASFYRIDADWVRKVLWSNKNMATNENKKEFPEY